MVEHKTAYRHQKTDATSKTTSENQPANRKWVIGELIDVVDQQVELATMHMKLDDIIKHMEQQIDSDYNYLDIRFHLFKWGDYCGRIAPNVCIGSGSS